MLLRGGQRTTSPLLDRIVYFDERSRNFPIRTTALSISSKPRSYTWSLRHTVLDQGHEGACVGFSFAHELAAKPVVVNAVTAGDARGIYFDAQRIDPWEGGAYEGAEPFYEGTSVLAGAKVLKDRKHYSEYRWGFGLDDLILGVGLGGPAVLGINWYEGMFRPTIDGYLQIGGGVAGGHAIVCLGVNLARQEFLLANSWGPDWSTIQWGMSVIRGHAKVTFETMRRLLTEDGEACFPKRIRLS